MSAQVLSFKLPVQPAAPLSAQLPAGRLVELMASRAGAQLTAAVACVCAVQSRGEPVAWVQPAGGSLFPPDLADSGVDLEALVIVHVPRQAGTFGPVKAAELLLRSGGFGLVVLDLTDAAPRGDLAWQGRLLGMSREHDSRVLLLTEASGTGSLGPLVSLCLTPERARVGRGRFRVEHRVQKDKSGTLSPLATDERRGPWGLS